MENKANVILEEIKAEISELRARLDSLEEKLAEAQQIQPEEDFSEPIDIDIEDVGPVETASVVEEPVPVEYAAVEVVDAPLEAAEPTEPAETVAEPEPAEMPAEEPAEIVAEPEPQPEEKPAEPQKPSPASAPVRAWKLDIPGSPVKNVISGISLNDRVLFINTLFKEDPMLFQGTIAALNKMEELSEAEEYLEEKFPDWNMGSDIVYRFMMAVRRRLR